MMPDITMCKRYDCPARKECYRFMAKPGPYQSYAEWDWKWDLCFMVIRTAPQVDGPKP